MPSKLGENAAEKSKLLGIWQGIGLLVVRCFFPALQSREFSTDFVAVQETKGRKTKDARRSAARVLFLACGAPAA